MTLAERLAQGRHLHREVAVLDRKSGPRRRDQVLLGHRLAGALDEQPQQSNRALTDPDEFGPTQQNPEPRIEAEWAKLVVDGHPAKKLVSE